MCGYAQRQKGWFVVRKLEFKLLQLKTARSACPRASDGFATTDEGGIAIVPIKVKAGKDALEIEAKDQEGNQASSKFELEVREGEDPRFFFAPNVPYTGLASAFNYKVFSTKARGVAYVDIVKEGQTVLTRDLDLENGEAELSLTASPEMAGTVDISA
jgi:hypothetical protein